VSSRLHDFVAEDSSPVDARSGSHGLELVVQLDVLVAKVGITQEQIRLSGSASGTNQFFGLVGSDTLEAECQLVLEGEHFNHELSQEIIVGAVGFGHVFHKVIGNLLLVGSVQIGRNSEHLHRSKEQVGLVVGSAADIKQVLEDVSSDPSLDFVGSSNGGDKLEDLGQGFLIIGGQVEVSLLSKVNHPGGLENFLYFVMQRGKELGLEKSGSRIGSGGSQCGQDMEFSRVISHQEFPVDGGDVVKDDVEQSRAALKQGRG